MCDTVICVKPSTRLALLTFIDCTTLEKSMPCKIIHTCIICPIMHSQIMNSICQIDNNRSRKSQIYLSRLD